MGAPVGNNNASRGAQIRSQIRAALSRADDKAGVPDGTTLNAIFDTLVDEARTSPEVRSELLDRLYGKPAQAVSVDGDGEGGPVRTIVERLIVRAQDPNTNG